MPYKDHMKIISADDHLVEHPRVWTDRLPHQYKDIGPHVVSDGHLDFWVYEDRANIYAAGLGAAAGREREEWSMYGLPQSAMIPGCYDPHERIKDMDIDGVWAQLCFPSYARFAGTRFLKTRDPELALLCVRAYNDFLLEEWCAAAPDRYIPLAILPLWDVRLAVVEAERVVAKGAKSLAFPEGLTPLGLPSFHTGYWDKLFAAACEMNVPLSSHIGTSQRPAPVSPDALGLGSHGESAAGLTLVALTSMAFVADLTFSHVFHKFSSLKIALSEGGVGWIPYLKERMDYTWERQRSWIGSEANMSPSELFDRHFWGCFIDDEAGIRERSAIGVNNMIIESDYPHSDTHWPHTRKRVAELLSDVPDDEAHKIVELNARELYNFYPNRS